VADVSGPAPVAPALTPDTTWQRLDATTLLAGSPVRLFRVTDAGARILDAIERGTTLPPGHAALTDRLIAAGAAHPAPADAPSIADVTVVVPCYAPTDRALAATLAPLAALPTIVVDDGSEVPIDISRVTARSTADVRLIRLPVNRGPGAARNAGLAEVTTPYVLFVDADAVIDPAELPQLLGHLIGDHHEVAAVAPRVHALVGVDAGTLGRYEEVRSPLDMGAVPANVRAGTRVGYVPAAVLLCRTEAVRSIGGFDESLRYGEDVDLVWRLAEAGWAVRYEPAAAATHAVRPSLSALLRQRYRYGTAAGALERGHPGALAPVRLSRWGLATWALLATGHPAIGASVATAGGVPLARKLATAEGRPRWTAAARVTVTGNLHAGRQLADATTSVWLPAALAGALVSKRARRVLLAAAVVPGTLEWFGRRPRLDPARFLVLRALERAAYGIGVIRGSIAARRLGPLIPRVE
jgi:mycofactocin system glycosyltransferase